LTPEEWEGVDEMGAWLLVGALLSLLVSVALYYP